MATVRFSTELKQQILDTAKSTMAPAVRRAADQRPSHDWGLRVYETIFAEVMPAVRQVPDHWFDMVGTVKLESVNGVSCNMEFNLPKPMPWPSRFVDTAIARRRSAYTHEIAIQHELFADLAAELTRRNQTIQEAHRRQAEFVEMVKKVIEAYATLAPAIKAWPPLWDLIPDQVKDRHRQVKERASKVAELDVDLSKLTAMSAAAKFGI